TTDLREPFSSILAPMGEPDPTTAPPAPPEPEPAPPAPASESLAAAPAPPAPAPPAPAPPAAPPPQLRQPLWFPRVPGPPFWGGVLGGGVFLWQLGLLLSADRAHLWSWIASGSVKDALVLLFVIPSFGVALSLGFLTPIRSYVSLFGRAVGSF